MAKDKAPVSRDENARSLSEGFVRFGQTASSKPLLPPGAEVRPHESRDLRSQNRQSYQQIRSQFTADKTAKSSRFSLSELVSSQLSVEVEEQRRFEKRVTEEVENQLSVVRREAMERGHAEGLEKGRAEAYEAERARLVAQVENLSSALGAIRKAREDLIGDYERQLVDVSFRLAELVVHTHISERPEMIHKTLGAILSRIAREEDVRIRLAVSDFESIDEIRSSIEEMSRSGRVSFDVDSSLKAGDCVVESSSGEIASFVEDSLAKLRKEMLSLVNMRLEGTGT